jgi:hypothetical protein
MTLTQGHPYLRNNDVYLCFIIFCIYTGEWNMYIYVLSVQNVLKGVFIYESL